MFKKVQVFVLANFGMLLMFIAGLGLDSRSMWTMYEPDIPDCLKK